MLTRKCFFMAVALLLGISCAGAAHALTDDYARRQAEGNAESRAVGAQQATAARQSGKYAEIAWDSLIPPSWDPAKVFEGFNFDVLADDDPRAAEAMKKFRKLWNEAPANPAMKDKLVSIAGYVAPLDFTGGEKLAEFLLVPYFGACIHMPPPPANQIIHVTLDKPRASIQAMDTVRVYGKLELEKTESGLGDSGYRMKAEAVEPYVEEEQGGAPDP